jgi:beta-glucosidase
MKRIITSVITLIAGFAVSAYSRKTPLYKDAKLPIEQRVDNLISLMTLEEKVEQLQSQLLFTQEFDKRNYKVGHIRNKAQ